MPPTYEFHCKACDHEFEVFQKITDDPVKTCPKCHKDEVEKKISKGVGIHFKGQWTPKYHR